MIAGVEEELLGSKGDWSDSWLSWHCALPGSVVLISALRHDLFKEGTPSGHPFCFKLSKWRFSSTLKKLPLRLGVRVAISYINFLFSFFPLSGLWGKAGTELCRTCTCPLPSSPGWQGTLQGAWSIAPGPCSDAPWADPTRARRGWTWMAPCFEYMLRIP